MKSCRRCREQMPEALYGELHSDARAEFDAHVAACPKCAAELADLQEAQKVLDLRTRPQPPDAFWNRVWPDLLGRLNEAGGSRRLRFLRWSPGRWAWNLAAAAALIAVGVFVDRYFFSPSTPHVESPAGQVGTEAPSLDERVDRYLERSKLVLWSVNNLKVPGSPAEPVDLDLERELSRSLIRETRALRRGLEASREDELLELMSQLEVILLQIANMHDTEMPFGIELARTGIENGALLFQINIEEMHRASERISKAKRGRGTSKGQVG